MIFGEGESATHVLKDISITIEDGEFVALMGPSGSGKSTLLSVAATLLSPTEGKVWIADAETTGLSQAELSQLRNTHLGFVFQFHHLLPDFTALENVLMPVYGRARRIDRASHERARELLVRVGLEERLDFAAAKLSGGQKQRVAVARALIMKPTLILADEPTGNLDRASSNAVMELMRELSREEGIAFLVSTHDNEIARACERMILLQDGGLVSEDAEIVDAPDSQSLIAAEKPDARR
jgi:lipoprotein-releasing system ATP-binding protein